MRAALAGALAKAWVVSGEARYQNAGRGAVRALAADLRSSVFADRQAYLIERLMLAAATLGEPTLERRGREALDALLQQAYARGWGVRHALSGPSSLGLLQDQVQVASACIAAYQLTNEGHYLDVARDLAAVMDRDYADSLGGYYDTPAAPGRQSGN